MLVNHWVDTAPAPKPSNARRINAAPFLERRVALRRQVRSKMANIVAVDFYRQGDVIKAVDALNGVG